MRSLIKDYGYWVWRRVRDRIATDADWLCTYCGREVRESAGRDGYALATIDHRIPLCRGGTWKRHNLICCCKGCNEDKGPLTEAEYRTLIAEGMAWFCRETPKAERRRGRREMLRRCAPDHSHLPQIHPSMLPPPTICAAAMPN